MEVSNDLILTAINDNSVEVAKLSERIDAMLATHLTFRTDFGKRIKDLEHRQLIMAITGMVACLTVVVNTGKGASILSAIVNMF